LAAEDGGRSKKKQKKQRGPYARRKRGQLRAKRPLKEEASLFSLERKWVVVLVYGRVAIWKRGSRASNLWGLWWKKRRRIACRGSFFFLVKLGGVKSSKAR
jgi:hypothetical protein